MRSMVVRDAQVVWTGRAMVVRGRASLSTALRAVPLPQQGEDRRGLDHPPCRGH